MITPAFSPEYSVIMPAYNASATIARSIESVAAQTVRDWELIVVDDGSEDDTAKIAAAYSSGDHRIRTCSQPNRGAAAARNTAIEAARAEYLVLLDADDVLLPEYMARMAVLREQYPGYDIYSCHAFTFEGEERTGVFRAQQGVGAPYGITAGGMLEGNGIYVSAAVRRDAVVEAGGFDPKRYAEDYDLWVRLLAAGARHIATPEVLAGYNMCQGKSAERGRELRSVIDTWTGVLEHGGPGVPEERLVTKAIERFEAAALRWEAERAAQTGDYRQIRSLDARARGAYRNSLTFWLARLLALAAPGWYVRAVRVLRERDSSNGIGR